MQYTAIARMSDGKTEWDVVIYDRYNSLPEATEGMKKFCEKYNTGYPVVKYMIVKENKNETY